MADTVIDSSVAVKWVLNESDSVEAVQKSNRVTVRGECLLILDLVLVVVTNAIAVSVRRKLLNEVDARDAWMRFQKAQVTILQTHPLRTEALDLAMKYKIAVYDAAFVAAVQSLHCDGVTADVPLANAVGADIPSIRLLKNW